jgi:hypothetical protein
MRGNIDYYPGYDRNGCLNDANNFTVLEVLFQK